MSRETRGTGKWAEAGVPHKGWRYLGMRELEEQTHLCEMCEARLVRYVHFMDHPDYENPLAVGCVCAGHMEQQPARAREREKNFKSYLTRRRRWLSRTWRISRAGNDYLRTDVSTSLLSAWRAESGRRASDIAKAAMSGFPSCLTKPKTKPSSPHSMSCSI